MTKVVLPSGDVIEYRYDAEGMRVKKVEGGSEVRYLMDGLRVLCEYEEGGGILREYVAGVGMKENDQRYYYITDRLGNVRYVLNESGAVVQSYLYTPFGQIHTESGSLSQPYQYVGGEGYYTEQEIGLKLLGQRWYDGGVGRFISRDPIGEEGGLNLYGYVGNNPVNEIDPYGNDKWKWLPGNPPLKPKDRPNISCAQTLEECLKIVNDWYQKKFRICKSRYPGNPFFGYKKRFIWMPCVEQCMGVDTQGSRVGEGGWRYEEEVGGWVLKNGVTDIALEYEKKCKDKFCDDEKKKEK